MQKQIFIEPETMKRAEANTAEAIQKAKEAIKDGTPDEIRARISEVLQASQAQRAFICANYNL